MLHCSFGHMIEQKSADWEVSAMTKIQLIQAETAKVPPERLDELYGVVRAFRRRSESREKVLDRIQEA